LASSHGHQQTNIVPSAQTLDPLQAQKSTEVGLSRLSKRAQSQLQRAELAHSIR